MLPPDIPLSALPPTYLALTLTLAASQLFAAVRPADVLARLAGLRNLKREWEGAPAIPSHIDNEDAVSASTVPEDKTEQGRNDAEQQTGKEGDSFTHWIEISKRLEMWACLEVLRGKGRRRRARAIERLIECAEACRALSNHSSMTILLSALSCPPISRLMHTWALVSSRHLQQLMELRQALPPRTTIESYSSKVELPCVPPLSLFLHTTADTEGPLRLYREIKRYQASCALYPALIDQKLAELPPIQVPAHLHGSGTSTPVTPSTPGTPVAGLGDKKLDPDQQESKVRREQRQAQSGSSPLGSHSPHQQQHAHSPTHSPTHSPPHHRSHQPSHPSSSSHEHAHRPHTHTHPHHHLPSLSSGTSTPTSLHSIPEESSDSDREGEGDITPFSLSGAFSSGSGSGASRVGSPFDAAREGTARPAGMVASPGGLDGTPYSSSPEPIRDEKGAEGKKESAAVLAGSVAGWYALSSVVLPSPTKSASPSPLEGRDSHDMDAAPTQSDNQQQEPKAANASTSEQHAHPSPTRSGYFAYAPHTPRAPSPLRVARPWAEKYEHSPQTRQQEDRPSMSAASNSERERRRPKPAEMAEDEEKEERLAGEVARKMHMPDLAEVHKHQHGQHELLSSGENVGEELTGDGNEQDGLSVSLSSQRPRTPPPLDERASTPSQSTDARLQIENSESPQPVITDALASPAHPSTGFPKLPGTPHTPSTPSHPHRPHTPPPRPTPDELLALLHTTLASVDMSLDLWELSGKAERLTREDIEMREIVRMSERLGGAEGVGVAGWVGV